MMATAVMAQRRHFVGSSEIASRPNLLFSCDEIVTIDVVGGSERIAVHAWGREINWRGLIC